MHIIKDNLKIKWEKDKDNPGLLGFVVYEKRDGKWVELDSQWTLMPETAPPFILWGGLERIMAKIERAYKAGKPIANKCVTLSYLDDKEIDPDKLAKKRYSSQPVKDTPLTLADFAALEPGQVVRLWYSCTNEGDFLWEHDHVDKTRVYGRFIYYPEMAQWSKKKADFLYECMGDVCRGSGAEPVWNKKPRKYRGC